ncbi:MAG: zinc ribbon domain-containing protein [Clostridia bacterium]|nr:zinc ribbon domain-containing protein [Clostridia bacterium]
MRKCSNCNKLCPDTEKFCQTCGLPTSVVEETVNAAAEHATAKKKKTGIILGIIGILAVVAAIAAILIIPKKEKGDPMHRFFDAQEKFIKNKELVDRGITVESLMSGEYKPAVQNISTDAELSFELDGLDLGALDLDELGLGSIDLSDKLSKLSLFFQIDSKDGESLSGVQLRYNGSSIITATIDKTEKGFGVYIPELSDKRYELTSDLLSKLMGSNTDGEALDVFDNDIEVKFDRIEDLKKSFEALKKDYEDIFYKGFAVEDFVQNDGAFKLESLGADAGNCREITYTPNTERLATMLPVMAERLKSDKALSNHILTLLESSLGESGMKLVLSALCSNGEIKLGENGLLPIFEKIAGAINNDREEIVKAIEEAKLTWRVVSKDDEVLAQYIAWDKGSITFEGFEQNIYFDVKDNGKSVINLITNLVKEGERISGTATLTEDGGAVKMDVTVNGYDPEVKSVLGIPYGRFNIDIIGADGSKLGVVIEVGESIKGGSDHKVTISGLSVVAGENAPDSIGFNLHTTDKESTVERATADAVRVESEEQLNSIMEEMSENLSGVMMKLMLALMF